MMPNKEVVIAPQQVIKPVGIQENIIDKRGLDSLILESDGQIKYVQSLLMGKKFNLLYRGSRDGWKWKNFHDWCDNKGPTISLVRSSKGKICGGYTSVSWACPIYGRVHKDNSSFLFSVSH
jgi:hypothetical protein